MNLKIRCDDITGLTIRDRRATDDARLREYASDARVAASMNAGFAEAHGLVIAFSDEAIGGIYLARREGVGRFNAEVSYWLGLPFWGRGYATAAVKAISAYGFEQGVHRLYASVHADNPASCRVLEKAGYIREGIFRDAAYKCGVFVDTVQYGMVRTT